MKNFDWKKLAISLLILIFVSLLPSCFIGQEQLQLGFPAVFYQLFGGGAALYRANFNPLAFLFDVVVVYAVIYGIQKLYKWILRK